MPNLRIIYANAADRAQLAASATAGELAVDNLRNNLKGSIWRASATDASISASWAQPQLVSAAVLAFCNLTSTATIRVRGYEHATDFEPVLDTGEVLACAYAPLGDTIWGAPLGINAFTRGGGAYGRVWFQPVLVRKLEISITDVDNPAGYIEAARLVIGDYWSPVANPDYGASVKPEDTSTLYRTEGGTQMTGPGTRYNQVALQLSMLQPQDRATLWRILRGNGKKEPVFFSLYPESPDPELEQAHQIYGRIAEMPQVSAASFGIFSAPLQIEEL